MQNTLTCKKR